MEAVAVAKRKPVPEGSTTIVEVYKPLHAKLKTLAAARGMRMPDALEEFAGPAIDAALMELAAGIGERKHIKKRGAKS
jgi:hypothetical protein